MKLIENSEHEHPITLCEWSDVAARLALVDRPEHRVYGLPPGGMIAAGFLTVAENCTDPADATHILIDCVRDPEMLDHIRRNYPNHEVAVLFDETSTDRHRGTMIMPWEAAEPPKPVSPSRTGMGENEWQLWQLLTQAIEGAADIDWYDPDTYGVFMSHVKTARSLVESCPTVRAMLE